MGNMTNTRDLAAIPRNEKGIEIDLMSHVDEEHIHIWYCVPAVECELIASEIPPLGLTAGEENIIRDLMRAGF